MGAAAEQTRIRSLARVARALSRSEELSRLLETAAEEARTAIDAASVSMSRLLPGTRTVSTIVNVGELGPQEVRWPEDQTHTITPFAGLEILDGLQTWVWALGDDGLPEDERVLLEQLEKGSSLGAQIVVDGGLWGEFHATRQHGAPRFDDLDAGYTEALLAIVAGAVSRGLRERSLEQLAYRDPLTGLRNRRALDEHARDVFVVPRGMSRTVTALTLDINRLKLVNDTHGHPAGDRLIRAVAADLEAAFRPVAGALVARVGGDEFTVLVSGPDPAPSIAICDELCARTWAYGPGSGVSAGAATVTLQHGHPHTPSDLFTAADRAQYVAKDGRLRTTTVSDLSAGHAPARPSAVDT